MGEEIGKHHGSQTTNEGDNTTNEGDNTTNEGDNTTNEGGDNTTNEGGDNTAAGGVVVGFNDSSNIYLENEIGHSKHGILIHGDSILIHGDSLVASRQRTEEEKRFSENGLLHILFESCQEVPSHLNLSRQERLDATKSIRDWETAGVQEQVNISIKDWETSPIEDGEFARSRHAYQSAFGLTGPPSESTGSRDKEMESMEAASFESALDANVVRAKPSNGSPKSDDTSTPSMPWPMTASELK